MKVGMRHGAGGEAMESVIKDVFLAKFSRNFGEVPLEMLDDAAVVNGVAITTDSYTVKPIFFPGGDIGRLAVCGTVNDLLMIGARPVALSNGMVVEEGFEMEKLRTIAESMASAAQEAGVHIVTGDFKVVERGGVDEVIVNTSGMGTRHPLLDENFEALARDLTVPWLADANVRDGDVIIVSGYIGDHGVAVLSGREGVGFETTVVSDVMPLNRVMEAALRAGGVAAAKDPTRGGLAEILNEWAAKSTCGIYIRESDIPIREEVLSACEFLGIDPLTIGNEGKAVLAVAPHRAEEVLEALRRTPGGESAAIIGEVRKDLEFVVMETGVGGKRIVERPIGDPVPRIC